MSHELSDEILEQLDGVAHELREVFSSRGHLIGVALDQDASFRNGERPRSALARELVTEATTDAAVRNGLGVISGRGGSRDLQAFEGMRDLRWRVRRAKVTEEDEYLIEASSAQILESDPDVTVVVERWVFAYTLDANNQLADIFASPVIDFVEGTPGHLVLGRIFQLAPVGSTTPPSGGGFVPTNQQLRGMEDGDVPESELA